MNQEFKQRRQKLYAAIGDRSVALLCSAKESFLSNGLSYSYRQKADFYYLTGITEPDVIAVFLPGRPEGEFILFHQQKNPIEAIWTGKGTEQEDFCKLYGADQIFALTEINAVFPSLLLGKRHLYFDFGDTPSFDAQVIQWLTYAKKKNRTLQSTPDDISHIGKIIHEMRLRNSQHEIQLLHKSAQIAAKAHLRAMQVCRPGMFEYQIEAELYHECLQSGAKMLSFMPIVAGGNNACTLHYSQNNTQLQDGDLLLIDAGVDYQYYTSDISRTFPVGKKFTAAQRLIYQAVLDTQMEVINKIRPGIYWNELQETSERIITKQLLNLGILRGEFSELLATKAFSKFYPHRIGHWLGLECHDVGTYAINEEWRILEAGMTFTIEPGIYIPSNMRGVAKKWHGIGVRIEDDILVTEKGCEVLTNGVPKTINEIEEIRKFLIISR